MDACRRNVSGEAPFTTAEDNRLALTFLNAGRMAWDVLQGIVFRTAGSRHARDGGGAASVLSCAGSGATPSACARSTSR